MNYDPPRIKINLLNALARIPVLGSAAAAGFDLYAVDYVSLAPGEIRKISLGFSTELPDHIHGRIESRSGLASKGIVVLTGVIDSDYRGEWMVILMNVSKTDYFQINPGDRIAQVVFRHTVRPVFDTAESLTETSRGAGGFGSTGK